MTIPTRERLESMSITELRKLSRGLVSGGYDMKKAVLIEALLAKSDQYPTAPVTAPVPKKKRKVTQAMAETWNSLRRHRRRDKGASPARKSVPRVQTGKDGLQHTTESWSWKATQTPPQHKRSRNRRRNKIARKSRAVNARVAKR